ncbi:MAG TPA: FG-GAP-like repeat-containing protein [Pyrinomonadaceae bacterium]|jgi:uncharacterized delta-60 repeat protein
MKTVPAFRIFFFSFVLFAIGAVCDAQTCVPASMAAGALDTCFGTGGRVTTDITADRDYSRALALQPDGKIVVAGISGYSATAGNADFTVVRYNTDGSLDTTFDGDGIVVTDFGPGTNDDDYCRGLAIQPDGKIVIGGRSFVTPTTYALAVIRYNPDGSLDTTFDGDGKAQFEMPAIIEMYGFALQPDGKILVAGRSFLNGSFTGLIARFNSNGSVDTSFGSNGSTTASIAGIFSVALQSDGKIVVAGSQGTDPAFPAFAVARLNPNGSPDIFFGNSGVVTYHPTFNDQTWFVKIRSDNQLFVGGHSSAVQGDARGALLRFGSDGTLGQSVVYPDQNAFWNMTFQPDGKALVVGASFNPSSGFTIRRYIDINIPDTTFGGGAVSVKFLLAGVPEASGVNAIAMTRDNKIVVAGSVTEQDNTTTGWRWAVTRLYSGLQSPHPERFDFDGDGKADLSIFRPSSGEWWYQKSPNGGNAAFQFGAGTDTLTPGDYTGDGKTDVAVWRPSTGEWFVLRSEDFSFFSIPFGTSGDIPRPADFDGDGKTDYIVYRPSQNFWYRINSIGISSFRQFGIAGDKPVIGDFDGDGKTDLAVYRPSTGQWWWQSSLDNIQRATQWGISTDIPTPADYDADGKTDFAVYRPSNGTWYIYNSSNNSNTILNFGISEDKPVPADYDGDGKADIAVFRPSTGVWYLMKSTQGFAALQFGISTDIPTENAFVP